MMDIMPFDDFDAMMNPMEPMVRVDPYVFNRFNTHLPRPIRRSMHHFDLELGNLISSVKEDDKSFRVTVDVSHFQPNEISVKTTDKNIIIHAKHEERSDDHGGVSREFRRRVAIPQGVNPESVTSTMSPEGVLTIMAPKMTFEGAKERVIPITMAPPAGSSTTATPTIQGK